MRNRSTQEVLEDHLAHRRAGDLEGDLRRNYATRVTLLSAEGVNRGHDAVRMLAAILGSYLPERRYVYDRLLVDGEIGMLMWRGGREASDRPVHDGVDTYLVRDGQIVAQTIHYSAG